MTLELVADRFELRRLVGSGGMGDVHQAFDRTTGELVAVKILMSSAAGQPLERFRREIQLLAEISDPRIVRYVAHGLTREGRPFLAMEWLEGCELAQRLAHGPFSVADAVALVRRVAEGLAVVHARGVVHRDVKPSNVFLVGGVPEGARLIDFGVARMIDAAGNATRSGVVVGTPGYMAPEQARGEREVDARADVYGLGCLLYECVVGEPLYTGGNMMAILAKILLGETPRLRDMRRDVPRELDGLVHRMLSRSANERPADASVVVAELARLPSLALDRRVSAVPEPVESRAITHSERRLVSVIMVRGARLPTETDADALAVASGDTITATLDPRLVVAQFGGVVEPLADGALVAVLSGKGTATDQAARAARCALELQKHLVDRPMVLATGFATPDSSLAAQEVIERAAMMLTAEARAAIRLDDVTSGLLDARFAVEGDERGLTLVGYRETDTLPRTLLGRPMPFVGRERELLTLLATLRECDDDSCARVVLVTAAPGVGKSRLARELARSIDDGAPQAGLAAHAATVWVAHADAMSEGSPFALLGEAIRHAAGIVDGETLAVRQMKLRARVARNVPSSEQGRVAEFLGEIVGAPFSDVSSRALRAARQDPRLMSDQTTAAFEAFVAAECASQPLVLVLEDLQWGDLPSVKMIDAALRTLADQPFFVVGFARPEVEELFPGLWKERDVTELRLAPLSKRASESLVKGALGDGADDDRVRTIVERASGNAFFLEELVRAAAEGSDEFPATVLAMIESRLDRLDPEARRVLRAASVFGATFWERGVATLMGGERALGTNEWLGELARRELVDRRPTTSLLGEREYAFRHALVREAAYATLTEADRTLGHKLAAEWLEARGEHDPAVLAEHYERGGDRARAVTWYTLAATAAYDSDDLRATHARAERAIACGATGSALGRLRFVQASGSLWASELEDPLRFGKASLEILDRAAPERFLAYGVVATAAIWLQRPAELFAAAEGLTAELGEGALTASQVIGAGNVAGSLYYGGFVARGDALLPRIEAKGAAAIADEANAAASVHHARAMRAAAVGDPEAELAEQLAAIVAFDLVGDRRNACRHRVNLGSSMQNFGLIAEAEEHLLRGLRDAERMGARSWVLVAKHNLGAAYARGGRYAEGIELEREAIAGFHEMGDRFFEAAARGYLATMLRPTGALEEARAEAERGAELFDDAPHARAPTLAVLALIEIDLGHADRALAVAEEAVALTKDRGIFEGETYVGLAYAEALHAIGRVEEAKTAIRATRARLLERAERIKNPDWRRAFLERVRENAQTLARAEAWLGDS